MTEAVLTPPSAHSPTLPSVPKKDLIFATKWEDRPKLPPPQPVIENFLYRGTLTTITAESGHGKTHTTLQIAKSILEGVDFAGKKAHHGKVLYVDFEMGPSTMQDYADVRIGIKGHFAVIHNPDPKDIIDLIKAADAEGAALVVIDTLQALLGASHNSLENLVNNATVIQRTLNPIQAAIRETNMALLLLHHTRKGSETFEGSQRIKSISDEMYTLSYSAKHQSMTLTPLKRRLKTEQLSWSATLAEKKTTGGTRVSKKNQNPDKRLSIEEGQEIMLDLLKEGISKPAELKAAFYQRTGLHGRTAESRLRELKDADKVTKSATGYALTAN